MAGNTGAESGGYNTVCYSRRAQRRREAPLASRGGPPAPVRDISTVGYPAFWAGPIGIGGRDAVKCPVKLKNTEAIPLFYKNTDQKWTVFSKKLILDKYKFIYSEKRLQGLQFKWHRLAGPLTR